MNTAHLPSTTPSKGRILCVTSNFPRWTGDSTTPFVLHLAQDLQRLGWTVDILAPHAPGTAKKEQIEGITVERFRYLWPDNAETVCYQGGALINLRKNKSNLLKLPALIIAEWIAVLWRLTTRDYDLVHSHWILPQGFVGAVSAKLLRKPQVLTVHGGDVFALKGKILNTFKRFALWSADAVTVNSSVTEKAVTDIYDTPNHLERIPMGVAVENIDKNSATISAIKKRYICSDGPLLIFVGRLVDEKGCSDLLHAIQILKSELPNTSAIIIGEGQDRENLETLSKTLEITRQVHFLGWIQPNEVLNYIAAGDAFVGPSRTAKNGWVEAQGLTFLESMVALTPVIATRSGGIMDSVKEGETGLLVDEHSPEQIANAIKTLHSDHDLAYQLTQEARSQVERSFSRKASAKKFSCLFERLIPSHNTNTNG